MKEENEITQEVKELLDSLEQHGQNARRQKELSDLIDGLEASSTKHHKLYPLWWIVGAAAACLLVLSESGKEGSEGICGGQSAKPPPESPGRD